MMDFKFDRRWGVGFGLISAIVCIGLSGSESEQQVFFPLLIFVFHIYVVFSHAVLFSRNLNA